jgi:succinate dehydrogenase hydrophobic anchor subunit
VTVPALDAPRSPYRRTKATRSNYELYGWVFMRLSGVLLLVLVFGHLFVNLVTGQGIKGVDFAFVAGKWSNPFWQVWDLAMLWLAMLHGTNGVRTIINDYADRDTTRFWERCNAGPPVRRRHRGRGRRGHASRPGERQARSHGGADQALPDALTHGGGAGRHVRRAGERRGGQLGVAHLGHRQGR